MLKQEHEYKLGVELQGVYDGVSVWVDYDNKMHNRWKPEDGRRYTLAQEYIDRTGGMFCPVMTGDDE